MHIGTTEAHELTGYNISWLIELVKSGRVEGYRTGWTWLLDRDSLMAYYNDRKDKSAWLLHRARKEKENG